jgi:demethylmenaquinone methyltransferase/2-methoxy-6-polyprenyl-1,4-benzoquinol methylase
MANSYYEDGAQRAEKVRALFARIARRYDLINDVQSFGLHRLWKRRLIRLTRPEPGQRALDICCGTGDLALALANQGLRVTGLDFSEPMLEIARRRTARLGLGSDSAEPTVSALHPETGQTGRPVPEQRSVSAAHVPSVPPLNWIQGDAQRLPFADGTFDIVTVGYGLRNLADWEVGLRQMHRVARRGGRLAILEFGKPPNPVWRTLYYAYLRVFVPMLGLVFCGSASAYAYILESLHRYPGQEGVAGKMRELGLAQVRVINLLGGVMTINYGEKA